MEPFVVFFLLPVLFGIGAELWLRDTRHASLLAGLASTVLVYPCLELRDPEGTWNGLRDVAHGAGGTRFLVLRGLDLLGSYSPAQAPRKKGLPRERLKSPLRAALEPLTWHSSRSLPPRKCSPTACGRSSQSRLP